MIKNIFYDLDGTLLPMDMDEFTNAYFGRLCKKLMPRGFEKDTLIAAIWGGTKMMVKNDGSKTNEEVFWDYFCDTLKIDMSEKDSFTEFYENEFDEVKSITHPDKRVPKLIEAVKELGFKQVLATNPIFPQIATKKRIAWAGLKEEDFETYTYYEDSHYCKPNLKYYEELLNRLGLDPAETLMIGNDVDEDMIASELGMKVFLITDYMLNPHNKDISIYPHGNFDDALEYIRNL